MNSKGGTISRYDLKTGNTWIRQLSPYNTVLEEVHKERNNAEARKDAALKALGLSTEKGTECEKEEAQNAFDSAMSYFQSMKKRYKTIFLQKSQEEEESFKKAIEEDKNNTDTNKDQQTKIDQHTDKDKSTTNKNKHTDRDHANISLKRTKDDSSDSPPKKFKSQKKEGNCDICQRMTWHKWVNSKLVDNES